MLSDVPKHDDLLWPCFHALRELGGSGTNAEIDGRVATDLQLSDDTLELPHNVETSNQTEFEYRMAWVRTYLKKYGLINNSTRGVWSILPDKQGITEFDPKEVSRSVREADNRERDLRKAEEHAAVSTEELISVEPADRWREELHRVLTKTLSPDGFERLIQRLLRECGFVQVVVTGRSGDGGIDGKGIAKVSGLLSFHVHFQCKRYVGSVGANHVRDFRGAMVGRADKGLLITTGSFTRDAVREATRDGAPPLDLVDGDELAEMLREQELGVERRLVPEYIVHEEFFASI